MNIRITKYFMGVLAVAALSLGVFAVAPAQAQASVWNDGKWGVECQTVTIGNYTTKQNINSNTCWGTSPAQANPGDVINVRLYYHNTSDSAVSNTTLRLNKPGTGPVSSFTFTGSVSGGGDQASGSSSVSLSSAQTLTFTGLYWHPDKSQSAVALPGGQSGSEIFTNGLNVGTVLGSNTCGTGFRYCHQGDIYAVFKVGTQTQQQCAVTFDVNPSSVSSGGSATISWSTNGCTNATVSGPGGTISNALSGSQSTGALYSTSTYTINASGASGAAVPQSRTVSVNQVANCKIDTFYPNQNSVSSGSSTMLTWSTSNCSNVTLSGGTYSNTPVSLSSSITTGNLYSSVVYTLTATGSNGVVDTDSTTVSVNSVANCTINSFYASPNSVSNGNNTTLQWNTSNCNQVRLSGGNYNNQQVSGTSITTGALYNTTTYTLVATGNNGTIDTDSTTVSVDSASNCSASIYAGQTQVSYGASTYITWNTNGCTSVYVSGPNINSSQQSGSQSTGPVYGSKHYTLTAYGSSGVSQNQSVTVYSNQNNQYQCSDGIDNDGDGYVDFPNDLGCSHSQDDSEYPAQTNTAPSVTTQPASNVLETSAIINGYITTGNNNGYNNYYFEYGTTPGNLSNRTNTETFYGTSRSVSANISNLSTNTTYYFRLVGTNSQGSNYGTTLSFVTSQGQGNVTAITTLATNIFSTSARLNGIVSSSSSLSGTSAYFEYGTSPSLGFQTNQQSLGSNSFTNYFSAISTSPNTTYYYRAVAVSNGITSRGSTVSFTTPSNVVNTNTTTTTTVVNTNTTNRNLVTFGTGGGSPLVQLSINDQYQGFVVNGQVQNAGFTNQFQNVAPGDIINYLVYYKNISDANLTNAVLNVILPSDVVFRQSTGGVLTTNNTVVAALGTLEPQEEGAITIQAVVREAAAPGSTLVATATLAFTTPSNGQDSAIAYALNSVTTRNYLAGLALFGGSFFPRTLLGWILLLGILLILILITRHYYYRRPSQTVHVHSGGATTVRTNGYPEDNLPH